MGLFGLFKSPWCGRLILILWLSYSVILLFLLGQIDTIVHHDLYNFHLEFDPAWANPYWNALHLIYALLAVPVVLSTIVLVASFQRPNGPQTAKRRNNGTNIGQVRTARNHSLSVRCINCGKFFRKPKTMLNLKNGKLQSANVCPHCQHVLGRDERVRMEFDGREENPIGLGQNSNFSQEIDWKQ